MQMQRPKDLKLQFADRISPEQQSVLDLETGHHLVQAPPGSGKTELLAQRLERVLDSGMPAENCACLTFTNRAARNMATRLGDRCRGAFVGNFHTLASRYLGGPEGSGTLAGILDQEDTGLFLDQAVADVISGWRPRGEGEVPAAIFSFMGASYERLQRVRQRLEVHELSINFRSPSFLLEILGQYARSELRADLNWRSLVAGESDRNDLLTMAFSTDEDEEEYLANHAVPKILEQHRGSVALLVRTNRQAARLSASLHHAGLDHFTVSSHDLFRLKIGKDFMAWLQSLARPEAQLPWIRLLQLCGAASSLKSARGLLRRQF